MPEVITSEAVSTATDILEKCIYDLPRDTKRAFVIDHDVNTAEKTSITGRIITARRDLGLPGTIILSCLDRKITVECLGLN
jgi:hypothetical protein